MAGEYDNWKPAIYSWMLGVLEGIGKGYGTSLMFALQIILMGIAVGGISHAYSRSHALYGLLALVLPLFYTTKVMLVSTVGNDELAAACYLLFIAGVLWMPRVKGRLQRLSCWFLCGGVLAIGLALRHNAVPAVALLLLWACRRNGVRGGLRQGGLVALVLAAMFGANVVVTYHLLEAKASYPLKSPFADDVVNISILNGQWEPICDHFAKRRLPPPHEFATLMPEVANGGEPIDPYIYIADPQEREQEYLTLQQGWWETVRTHPMQYFLLKGFFFHQFLLEGRCLPWVTDALLSAYPHIRIAMDEESRCWKSWVNREFVGMSLVPLLCYAGLLLFIVRRIGRRHAQPRSALPVEMSDSLYFIGASMLYTFSFVLLVLSATEQRYYIVQASLTCMAGPLFLLAWWVQRKRR